MRARCEPMPSMSWRGASSSRPTWCWLPPNRLAPGSILVAGARHLGRIAGREAIGQLAVKLGVQFLGRGALIGLPVLGRRRVFGIGFGLIGNHAGSPWLGSDATTTGHAEGAKSRWRAPSKMRLPEADYNLCARPTCPGERSGPFNKGVEADGEVMLQGVLVVDAVMGAQGVDDGLMLVKGAGAKILAGFAFFHDADDHRLHDAIELQQGGIVEN